MNLSNVSFLVHTFNQYERYWDGFLKGFHEYLAFDNFNGLEEMPLYFGTDTTEHAKHDFQDFKVLYSGKGEWSDRLINLLGQISTEYVIYIQEDMWPNAEPPNIEELMHWMQQNDVWRLQISPIVQFYSLTGSKIPLFFHYKSKYLMSHQPSIWKRSFLLRCLEKNEDPWKNEYQATKRLNHEGMAGKIAIYPWNWFSHESIKGMSIKL